MSKPEKPRAWGRKEPPAVTAKPWQRGVRTAWQLECGLPREQGNTAKELSAKLANAGPKFPLRRIWILILWAMDANKAFLLGQ